MHLLRERIKRQLIREWNGKRPICPLTGKLATDLHEVISFPWPQYGSKYGSILKNAEKWVELARLYFVPELCVLLSNEANVTIADSRREELLQHNMERYGPERVIEALRRVAQYITCPNAYIPASIDFRGKTYQILEQGE